ncbi:DUF6445 family protein [Asticcacaulis sp.]|uniref:DUF6445 family protein n=1 Tax=Asticcacaulis sp. TaxID=1872648 RepID=UPI002CE55DEE|nr:DUF6445 family protein [Asticcacaulis sp.]HTM81536.1 DUF6445 family protein [Asticcacaulis sp.]
MVDLSLNPAARLSLRHVGGERNPLLIIDEVLKVPKDLVDIACDGRFIRPENTVYPGLNGSLPESYSQDLILSLRPVLERAFGLPSLPLSYFGFFGMATAPPSDLVAGQRVPHFDSTDPFRLALVHYLCRGPFGGTGFFRHKSTGYEGVDRNRLKAYQEASHMDLASAPAEHVGADTAGYEMIESVDLMFNRLIVYRSHVLHSPLLRSQMLTSDPQSGRLTANSFVYVSG